nr:hypothetical protein [Tanacetum cinerariifolium]
MPVYIIVKNTRTMDMTIDQQVALDEALVPYASRLRIGKRNFCFRSDITSKESTPQLVYDVLEILHICPRLPSQKFNELPFEEEILAFLRFFRHTREIRKLTDNTQQFGVMLPIELTNEDIKNSEAYKEYYAVAAPPKTKASARKTKSSFDTSITPSIAAGTRLSTSAKGKQPAKASKAKSADEGTGIIPGVLDVPTAEFDEEISWKSSDEDDDDVDAESDAHDDDDDQDNDNQDVGDGDDNQDEGTDEEGKEFIHPMLSIHDEEETKDEERFDPIAKTLENSDDEGNDGENLGLNVGCEEGQDEEDDEDELYRDVNINLEGKVVQMADVHTTQEFEDTHVTLTLVNPDGIDSLFDTTSQMDVLALTTVAFLTLSAPTLTHSTIPTISTVPQAPTPPTTAPSTLLQDLLNFGSLAISSILKIIQRYMDQRMNEAIKIEKTMNEQLEAKVLTRSSNSSKTSYTVAADLSEIELKKILIEKMESNKSIYRSDEQRNLYKALVKAYEFDKIILDTYGDIVTLKRCRDNDVDKDVEPSAGSDRGSKRRREGKEPKSTSALKKKATRTFGKSTQGLWAHQVDRRLGASHNVESRAGSLLEMSALNIESSLSLNLRLSSGIITSIWIGSRCVETMTSYTSSKKANSRGSAFKTLKICVKSYQKKLNLTKPDTYRSDLKCKEAYTVYSNPRGFIYQSKDKQNRLMRIDKLRKFSEGTLNDVRTALDDRLKGIRMKYLPQTIWRKSDMERVATMIQAIDKQLKTRRIMRSLEKFVSGRLYEGDFKMLQRTI